MAEAAHSISPKPAAVAEFNWEDPLDLESHLTEEERMIRDSVRDFAEDKATHLKEVAGEKAAQFKEVAEGQWEDTRDMAREAHADLEKYIRQHPTKSVLAAAGVGLLLGLIIRR